MLVIPPNSAAERAFLAEIRDESWAGMCEGDVMRRIWGICTWSDTTIEEIVSRTTLCRVTVNMGKPGVLASLYTNIALQHLYGDGVHGLEWNELPAPSGRFRAVFYLVYHRPALGLVAQAAQDRQDRSDAYARVD